MKKFYLLGLAFLLCGWIHAENVSQQTAEKWALQFFQQRPQARSNSVSLQMVWNGENPNSRQSTPPAFYVFNRTDQPGFIIVSGDDKAAPVLGYSFEHSFVTENMPVNVRSWLLARRDEINWARGTQEVSRDKRWNVSRASIGTPIIQLRTADWNQDDPYNRLCPVVNGTKTYTGCTATALAIAMRYRQWPDAGQGSIPSYFYKVNETQFYVSGRNLGTAYQWDKMPLTVNSSTSEESKDEIARLMMDVAVMIQSTFDSGEGTGAIAQTTDGPLGTYMKYSRQMKWLDRDNFGMTQWIKMLKDELKNNGPVPYTGASDKSAHAFVLDGVTDKDYFRVNWGWSGSSNGYYLLTALAPGSGGIGGGDYDYRLAQSALFNMRKAVEGEVAPVKSDLEMTGGLNNTVYEFGLRGSTNYFKKGDQFDLQMGSLYQNGSKTLNFLLGVSVFDKEGKWKADISSPSYDINDFKPGYYYANLKMPCSLNVAPVEGDYMALAAKKDGSTEWKEIPATLGTQGRIPLVGTDRPIIGDPFMMVPGTPSEKDFHGIYSDAKEIVPGKEFKVHTGVLRCLSGSYQGRLAVVLYDVNNQWKVQASTTTVECKNPSLGSIWDEQVLTCKLKDAIKKGEYLALAYYDSSWGDWKRIKGIDFVSDRILLDEKEPQPLPDLEGNTSMTYQIETGELIITTFAETDYELKTDNKILLSGKSNQDGKITIDSKTIPEGIITLTLKYGEVEKIVTLEWTKE